MSTKTKKAVAEAAERDAGPPNQPPPPTHWRITAAGEAAGIGWVAGTIVPAVDLAPQTGAMHERKLIEPATAEEWQAWEAEQAAAREAEAAAREIEAQAVPTEVVTTTETTE